METNSNNNPEEYELQQLASKKVVKLKSFYKHTFLYLIALTLYLLKEYTELPLHFIPINFLNDVVIIIWSAVYVGSAIDMFVSFRIFGHEWEERKLRSLLEKKNKKQKWE
ncbi:2TM domain-containing protein [Flavobacterium endoglycinae]|uniref:2TM domain-containing protein n=1 Tax=Flavobacterium endoglycinae TaxID=2816357 RepID=A0ABX7QA60_9FLAO|nr:2TM domain-containing protein [Flavobacterium endoglycinae]QSW87904.1 2TM domain-containing protein [Flavobacterium endoglycinae]